MKLAPKILAASVLATAPFCAAGGVHAVPLGMGVALHDAITPAAETVRLGGGGGRVGGGGARVGGGGGRVGGGGGRVGGGNFTGNRVAGGNLGNRVGNGNLGDRWQGDRWGNRPGWWAPGAGLAAGAIVGGALGSSYYGGYGYDNGYYYPGYDTGYAYPATGGQDAAYCAQRYKSYDPSSGTYLGYDGVRHPCP